MPDTMQWIQFSCNGDWRTSNEEVRWIGEAFTIEEAISGYDLLVKTNQAALAGDLMV